MMQPTETSEGTPTEGQVIMPQNNMQPTPRQSTGSL